jgi:hypothetical protein
VVAVLVVVLVVVVVVVQGEALGHQLTTQRRGRSNRWPS